MTVLVGIVDLDMGNLRSVANAIAALGYDARIARQPEELSCVTHLILPGVGAFATAMAHMREQALFEPIRRLAECGIPILGICLGMQLLASHGEEGGITTGLGLIPGRVIRFEPSDVPAIPHVGWNEVRLLGTHPVFEKLKTGRDFYFVHSYHFGFDDPANRLGVVEYGGRDYASIVGRKNVLGFQFHPEKSQANGLRLLENFCEWNGGV
jgi:glutamine amidotransferase